MEFFKSNTFVVDSRAVSPQGIVIQIECSLIHSLHIDVLLVNTKSVDKLAVQSLLLRLCNIK